MEKILMCEIELHLSCAVIFHASSDESFGNLKKTTANALQAL
jgi:hypothetical protein